MYVFVRESGRVREGEGGGRGEGDTAAGIPPGGVCVCKRECMVEGGRQREGARERRVGGGGGGYPTWCVCFVREGEKHQESERKRETGSAAGSPPVCVWFEFVCVRERECERGREGKREKGEEGGKWIERERARAIEILQKNCTQSRSQHPNHAHCHQSDFLIFRPQKESNSTTD